MYNIASCWLYLREYIKDARSHERQIDAVATVSDLPWGVCCLPYLNTDCPEAVPGIPQSFQANTGAISKIQLGLSTSP